MKAFDYQPTFKKTQLSNGVRVLSEHHPYSRATSVGCYVNLGTRDEPQNLNGAAHFLEHLLFKGTPKRSAYDIVKDLEIVGGEINAFTSRENTCFHASTLREHTSISLDVLGDLLTNANFSEQDVDKERQVILQEIDMTADLLEEYIFDLYFEKAYVGHDLCRPILGTPDSLKATTHKQLTDFYKTRYCGSNLIVSVAGHVEHDKVCEQVEALFGSGKSLADIEPRTSPEIKPFVEKISRPSEQVHLLMGLPSTPFSGKRRFEAFVVNTFLGGGMTSQLYQKIREDKGLAYNVYSYLNSFTDSGLIMTYAATSKEQLPQVVELIHDELTALRKNGLTQEELEMFRMQVVGGLLLGADDIDNRMNSIAVNEMVFGEYRQVDKVVSEVEGVNLDSINEYIEEYLNTDLMGTLILGDV